MATKYKLPVYSIHSKKGAAQFSLIPAFFDGTEFKSKGDTFKNVSHGCLMVETANFKSTNANGNMVYDWENKVTMKLNPTDIQMLLAGFREGKATITHQFTKNGNSEKQISYLNLNQGQSYGFFLSMNRPGIAKTNVSITSPEDVATLRLLLQRAIVKIMGW